MKRFCILLVLFLGACATRGVKHHMAAYKDCVYSQAMDMLELPHSTEDIARIAMAQCQGNLAIVNETLRTDNAWMEYYGSNADAHSEKLRVKTNVEVIEEIKKVRDQ